MKKERSTLSKKITGYSSLAASLLTVSNLVNAQIVYTDVNPDNSQAGNGAEYDLDLNNDATVDFKITITSNGAAVKMAAEALGAAVAIGQRVHAYVGSKDGRGLVLFAPLRDAQQQPSAAAGGAA